MSDTKTATIYKAAIETYSITPSDGGIVVKVTSGTLAGSSAKFVSTPGIAAYFSEPAPSRRTATVGPMASANILPKSG